MLASTPTPTAVPLQAEVQVLQLIVSGAAALGPAEVSAGLRALLRLSRRMPQVGGIVCLCVCVCVCVYDVLMTFMIPNPRPFHHIYTAYRNTHALRVTVCMVPQVPQVAGSIYAVQDELVR